MTGQPIQSLEDCRVLVVDDNEDNRYVATKLLHRIGVGTVEIAEDGIIGLEKAAEFHPDLIVLDIMMPNLDGFGVLQGLRSNPAFRDVPVLVQTASDTPEHRVRMFTEGGTDFVSKPLIPREFQGRVRVHLENRLLVRRLSQELARVDEELSTAEGLQRNLMPDEDEIANLRQDYGLSVAYEFKACSRLGGDFWGALPLDETQAGVFICDFAGHGVSAALNTFRLHTLILQEIKRTRAPGALTAALNDSLKPLMMRGDFATFMFGTVDTANDVLTYAAAAVPNPIIGRAGTGITQVLDGRGLPLGISVGIDYAEATADFPPGSFMLLYSDALFECRAPDGEAIGKDGFIDLVDQATKQDGADAAGIVGEVMARFRERVPEPLNDDLTCVCITR